MNHHVVILFCKFVIFFKICSFTPQPNVISEGKEHSLNLVIHLETSCPTVNRIIYEMSNLPYIVNKISTPDENDQSTELLAGVGFGPEVMKRLVEMSPELQSAPEKFEYPYRKGPLGEMPDTGGDIFIHAKSNVYSKLFELAQLLQSIIPKDCVQQFEDIYGFSFKKNRDLSGFIDGTANRNDPDGRFAVAVNKQTGGSFCLTQKWIHDFSTISSRNVSTLEGWVGRKKTNSRELEPKSNTSHVARMTSGPEYRAPKPFEIVRQSMPFGSVRGDAGLFFLAFAAKPDNFEFMLDRMVGNTDDGLSDDIMRISKCVTGNYWYFPSREELMKIALKYS